MLSFVSTSYAARMKLNSANWLPINEPTATVSGKQVTIRPTSSINNAGIVVNYFLCYNKRGTIVTPVTINDSVLGRMAVNTSPITGHNGGGCNQKGGAVTIPKAYIEGLTRAVTRTITFHGPGVNRSLKFTVYPKPPVPVTRHVKRLTAPASVRPNDLVTFRVDLDYPVARRRGEVIEWTLTSANCFERAGRNQIAYKASGFNRLKIRQGNSFKSFTVRAKGTSSCVGRSHSIEIFTNGYHDTSSTTDYIFKNFRIVAPRRR